MPTNSQSTAAAALGETLAAQMKEQEKLEAQFREQQEQTMAQVKSARDEILQAFLRRKEQGVAEYPPQIIEIANALMAQPRLIQPVQQFIATLVAKINNAVNEVIAEMVSDAGGKK